MTTSPETSAKETAQPTQPATTAETTVQSTSQPEPTDVTTVSESHAETTGAVTPAPSATHSASGNSVSILSLHLQTQLIPQTGTAGPTTVPTAGADALRPAGLIAGVAMLIGASFL